MLHVHDDVRQSVAVEVGRLRVVNLCVETGQEPASDLPEVEVKAATSIRVLIVDDEEDVAELNAEILMRGGYEVDVFSQGDLALESLRSNSCFTFIKDFSNSRSRSSIERFAVLKSALH